MFIHFNWSQLRAFVAGKFSVIGAIVLYLVGGGAILYFENAGDEARVSSYDALILQRALADIELLDRKTPHNEQDPDYGHDEALYRFRVLYQSLQHQREASRIIKAVGPLAEQLRDAIGKEMELIRAEDHTAASRVHRLEVKPTEHQLAAILERLQTELLNHAQFAERVSMVATVLGLLLIVVLTIRGAARQKRLALRQLAEQSKIDAANRANQEKTAFLSRMSHELRTPLNAVLGFAQVLEFGELDSRERESVKQIHQAGQHLLHLINEVLDISRIEAGNISLSLEPVNAKEVVDAAVDMVGPVARSKNIVVDISEGPGEDLVVLADQQRLRQCLINILSNAVKYNRPGGSIALRSIVREGVWRFEITDTGQGIPEEAQSRLFTPFDRLGAETSPTEGTGLGLALSKRLMTEMGGQLGLAHSNGAGSTFYMEVQISRNEDRVKQEQVEIVAPTPSIHPHTILYIEDNKSNQLLVQMALARDPTITLLLADNGKAGLEAALRERPDLVLLDLHLPEMEGRDVLIALRRQEETSDLPIVVLSADASQAQIERLLASGATGYLTKPLDLGELWRVIGQVLEKSAKQVA